MEHLDKFTPTTLVAMIADLSQFLAEEYDSENTSAQEWDKIHNDMTQMVIALDELVGDAYQLVMDAGADPSIVFDGAPE